LGRICLFSLVLFWRGVPLGLTSGYLAGSVYHIDTPLGRFLSSFPFLQSISIWKAGWRPGTQEGWQGPAQICFWTWVGSYWDGVGFLGTALAANVCSEVCFGPDDHATMEGTHCMTRDCTGGWMRRPFFAWGRVWSIRRQRQLLLPQDGGPALWRLATIEWNCSNPPKRCFSLALQLCVNQPGLQ